MFDQSTLTGHELKAMRKVMEDPEDEVFALYFVARKREEPSFTWKQALEASITDVMDYLGLDNPLTKRK